MRLIKCHKYPRRKPFIFLAMEDVHSRTPMHGSGLEKMAQFKQFSLAINTCRLPYMGMTSALLHVRQ